jgi:hypothetical protein
MARSLPAAAASLSGMAPSLLTVETLRPLTLARGAHVSAASGLVCAGGLAWVIADDLLHLACFRNLTGAGTLQRLLPGRLPRKAAARKAAKPDFECLFAWRDGLVALGSGSRPQRETGVWITPRGMQRFDLTPVYAPLRERLGAINIEGAFVQDDQWVLLQRGVAGGAPNAVARWPLQVLERLLAGTQGVVAPQALREMRLGTLDDVPLAFTDGSALEGGHWLFTAAAEDTRDSYLDGACRGSVVGLVGSHGRVLVQRRLRGHAKVEGIAAQRDGEGCLHLALVTDADDPAQPAWLLRTRW